MVEWASADTRMVHIWTTTRRGSVCYTDAFWSYQLLQGFGNQHTISHSKSLVDVRTKNHIRGSKTSDRLPRIFCTITGACSGITF